MATLVTGGNGFVGQHLIKTLKENSSVFGKIINVSRREFNSPYVDMNYRCDLGTSDYNDPEFYCLRYIMKTHDPEYIFHLASKATVKMDGTEPFDIIQDNILSTQKICEWAPKGARVVLASSVIVYGDWMFQEDDVRPYVETDRTEPTSIYGMTKRASEGVLKYHTSTEQINGVSARMCATVGRGLTHGVVYDFIRKILNNPTLEALGSFPGSTKPYMHVDDLVKALSLLALKKKASGEFNVVPDDVINIQEVAESVMDGLDVYKEIEWLGDGANWKGDNKIISASNQKLKDLGWSPDYTSKQAIKKSVEDSKA
jgi:UDP-glucose 4-epimerase|tara:strand:+ start:23720 stop:24661 length:942 start_codon:yes stop_codon:yes gene_type:complete